LLISLNRRCRDWNDYVTAPGFEKPG